MNPSVSPRCPVLCIDDDAATAALLAGCLARRPHLCLHHVRSGAEASTLAQTLRPALLLVAAQLPDCTGSELAPLLRLRHHWGRLPVVGLSRRLPLTTGAAAFDTVWCKPLSDCVVLPFIDAWLPAPARPGPRHTPADGAPALTGRR